MFIRGNDILATAVFWALSLFLNWRCRRSRSLSPLPCFKYVEIFVAVNSVSYGHLERGKYQMETYCLYKSHEICDIVKGVGSGAGLHYLNLSYGFIQM